ncbi:peptidylprolyl isomerase [Coraliomargarita parva]|uniref:peptidylprolyl isomerase n=1 Tax=Coraliomargarita parva TaxID=3014050 RepID=UPI0022B37054|nr:peptidylprolyl isomerase [Coraliomargarita parva]
MIRRLTLKPFLFSSIFLAAAAALPAQQPSADQVALLRLGNGIAAIAEGQIITQQELRKELEPIIPRLRVEARNQQEFNQRIEELSREVLQNMIDRIIIVKAAEKEGLMVPQSYIDQEYDEVIATDFGGDRAVFLEFLKTQGLTPRDFRADLYKRIVVNVMRQRNRMSQSEVSPERIEDFYVRNKLRFYQNEAVHLRQIILTSIADEGLPILRQTARTIMQELDNGTNFGDLARQYSQDDMSRRGGDWGWIERQDIRKELSEIAFDLEPGQYSQPVELNGTIFILYAEDKREEMIQPISMVRDIIEEVLSGEIARETQERWIRDLRSKSYIRYYM